MNASMMFFIYFVVAAAAVVGGAMVLRYKNRELEHRERMAAIEKGVPLPPSPEAVSSNGLTYYRRGLIWLFTGISLAVLIGSLTLARDRQDTLEDRIFAASIARSRGATESQVQEILKERPVRQGPPPALALVGLLPAGVGLAYLLTYRAEKQASRRTP